MDFFGTIEELAAGAVAQARATGDRLLVERAGKFEACVARVRGLWYQLDPEQRELVGSAAEAVVRLTEAAAVLSAQAEAAARPLANPMLN